MSTFRGIMKSVNTSSKYFKDRWEETLGYTLAEKFSGYDVICARINYGFEMDFDLERYIEANFSLLGTEEFWAAVVSSKFSIYDDWREYKEKGKDFRDIKLMEVISGDYPLETKKRCIEEMKDSPYMFQRFERPKASRIKKEYKER